MWHSHTARNTVRYLSLLVLLLSSGFSGSVSAADNIAQIRITGNETTQDEVILHELHLQSGEEIDLDRIEKAVQNVRDLELFESVNYYLEQTSVDSQTDLVIEVKERYYFFLIPTAKTNDNNQLEYGAKMIWNNVMGLNHTLKWKLLDTGSTAGVNEYKNDFKYIAPSVFRSIYQLSISIRSDVFVDDDPVFGLQKESSNGVGVDILRWLNPAGLSKGFYAGIGVEYRSRDIEAITSTAVTQGSVRATSLKLLGGFSNLHEHQYNRSGFSASYTAQHANDATGPSGTEFFLQELDIRHLIALSKSPPENINYHVGIGTSTNDVLGDKAFKLGGNTTLRGYEIGTFRGNTQLYGSIEYLSMLSDNPYLRKVLFADFGQAVPSLSDLNLGHLDLAIGAGIRWKVRKFVKFNLRTDLAYGFDTEKFRIAIGAKHTF